jgi:Zn-dependent peptidase ImmA (M78 family)/transcriptional regulator with XRE-family HTH domain
MEVAMAMIPEDTEAFGQRLVLARRAGRKTQEQVADHLGMSRPTYIALEKGSRRPKAGEVMRIAEFIGCQVSDLLRVGKPIELQPHKRQAMGQLKAVDPELDAAVADMERFADDYLRLEQLLGRPLRTNLPPVEQLPARGGVAEVVAFAEDLAGRERSRLRLGDQPVPHLRTVLESEVGIRIYYGPMPSKASGMYAYSTEAGCVVMINIRHPATRRRMSLAHEYGHVMIEDRYKPGVDYVHSVRKPINEKFVDAFAMALLMPVGEVRRVFHDVVNRTGDFQVSDLVRAASFFAVSAQAMALRMEGVDLIPQGTWDSLRSSGLKPDAARQELGEPSLEHEVSEPVPSRFRTLAVQAFQQALIGEGELARLLRVDRIRAREIVQETQALPDLSDNGVVAQLHLPFDRSLVSRTA